VTFNLDFKVKIIQCQITGRPVTIGTPMVLSVFDDWYSVRIAKNSQKTVKQHKMTIGVQIVTCLHKVHRIHKAAQTPLPRETSITCLGTGHSRTHPWTGLTLCVYMDVHASGSRSLPRAATLSSLPTDDACSSSSLSTTVNKFSIFSDPTRKISALPPELRRIR